MLNSHKNKRLELQLFKKDSEPCNQTEDETHVIYIPSEPDYFEEMILENKFEILS